MDFLGLNEAGEVEENGILPILQEEDDEFHTTDHLNEVLENPDAFEENDTTYPDQSEAGSLQLDQVYILYNFFKTSYL